MSRDDMEQAPQKVQEWLESIEEQQMKKIKYILIILIMCISAIGCSSKEKKIDVNDYYYGNQVKKQVRKKDIFGMKKIYLKKQIIQKIQEIILMILISNPI